MNANYELLIDGEKVSGFATLKDAKDFGRIYFDAGCKVRLLTGWLEMDLHAGSWAGY